MRFARGAGASNAGTCFPKSATIGGDSPASGWRQHHTAEPRWKANFATASRLC